MKKKSNKNHKKKASFKNNTQTNQTSTTLKDKPFVSSKKTVYKKIDDWPNTPKKKAIFYTVVCVVTILLLYFILNFATFVNFLLGNDTLIKLTPSAKGFNLANAESANINFDIFVSTNMFCKVECDYTLTNLGTGKILDRNSFSKNLANPFSIEYTFVAPETGEGQVLYNFDLVCSTQKQGLCKSEEEGEKRRSVLIPLNYELNKNQIKLKEKSEENLLEIINNYEELKEKEQEVNYLESNLEKHIILDNKSIISTNYSKEIENLIESWKNYKYDLTSIEILSQRIDEEKIYFDEKIIIRKENVTNFNKFVEEFSLTQNRLKNSMIYTTYSSNDLNKLNTAISLYNDIFENLSSKFYLQIEMENLNKFNNQLDLILELNGTNSYQGVLLKEINLDKLNLNKSFEYKSNLTLTSPSPICCYSENCSSCCNESCSTKESLYPILLLHGHSFNEKISAEKSLNDLEKIQRKLTQEEMINAGQLILGKDDKGLFEKTNKRLVFAGSYYFDIYQNQEDKTILQTNSDDINTYAIRLNDLINEIKLETGKDKVILVSHSMGGLVSRKYLQIYGDESVSQLIMIGTPNNGIDGTILSGCSVLGANAHCEDMDKESLLINKLNYGQKPSIPITSIIGRGCNLDGENSDGVVKASSAYLDGANNVYVGGTCNGLRTLHNDLLDPQRYPEVYEQIVQSINISS